MEKKQIVQNLVSFGIGFLTGRTSKRLNNRSDNKQNFIELTPSMIEARKYVQNFYRINTNLIKTVNQESYLSLNNVQELRNAITAHLFNSINYKLEAHEVDFINKSLSFDDILYEFLDFSSYTASSNSVKFSEKSKSKIKKIFPNKIVFRKLDQVLKNKADAVIEQLISIYGPQDNSDRKLWIRNFSLYPSSTSTAPFHKENKANYFIVNNSKSDLFKIIEFANTKFPYSKNNSDIGNKLHLYDCITNCVPTIAEDIAYALKKISADKLLPDNDDKVDYIKHYLNVLNSIIVNYGSGNFDLSSTYNVFYYYFLKRIIDESNDSVIEKFKNLNYFEDSSAEPLWV